MSKSKSARKPVHTVHRTPFRPLRSNADADRDLVHEWMASAVAHHQAGRLADAEPLYRRVLERQPGNADALHLLGVLADQSGNPAAAASLIRAAIAARDTEPAFHLNLGNALRHQNEIADTLTAYRRALVLKPDYLQAHFNLANLLREQGRYADSVFHYTCVLDLQPDLAEAHNNLALALQKTDDAEGAREHFAAALRLRPDYAIAHNNLGNCLAAQGDHDAARDSYREAVRLQPDYAEALYNLGKACHELGQLEEATVYLRQALEIAPDYSEANNELGIVLSELGKTQESSDHFARALAGGSGDFSSLTNLGRALQKQGDLEGARDCFRRALGQRPDAPAAYVNLGKLSKDMGEDDPAEACFRQALALDPDDADANNELGQLLQEHGQTEAAIAHFERARARLLTASDRDVSGAMIQARFNLAFSQLTLGDLTNGWESYEARWSLKESPPRPGGCPFPYPEWRGESLAGRTLLVYAEQGVGDEILFATCLPDLIAQAEREGGQIVVECDRRLEAIFARSMPGARFIGSRGGDQSRLNELGHVDCQIPLGSLMSVYRRTVGSFPQPGTFLRADPARKAEFASWVERLGPGLKVGFSWRSMLRSVARNRFYTDLSQWEALFSVPGIVWVNLQYDRCEEELTHAQNRFGVTLHQYPDLDLKDDLDGAAALTATLDLVIGPSSSVSVMGEALGVPAWQLLPYGRVWTELGTDRYPWFAHARMFHQPSLGDWDGAIRQMVGELRAVVAERERCGSPEALLPAALERHQAGDLAGAAEGYRRALEAAPEHPGALHLLGVVAHQTGQHSDAVELIRASLERDAAVPAAHNHLGVALLAQGETAGAIRAFQQALELRPDFAEVYNNLGNAFKARGDLATALSCYREAVRLAPSYATAHRNVGTVQLMSGNHEDALAAFETALSLTPDDAEVYNSLGVLCQTRGDLKNAVVFYREAVQRDGAYVAAYSNLGSALRETGDYENALRCFDAASALAPDHAEARYNRGLCLQTQGKDAEALASYDEALRLHPDYLEAIYNRGMTLQRLDRIDEAASAYCEALRLDPDYIDAHNNLGMALQTLDDLDGAIACYEATLRRQPEYSEGIANLALALHAEGRLDEALERFDQALRLHPNCPEAHFNRALALLTQGDLGDGWREYEWRERRPVHRTCPFPQPRWDGGSLSGKTLLVYAEQGIGDEILFASCLPDVIAQAEREGGRVVIECEPRLAPAWRRSFPGATVVGAGHDDQSWLAAVPPLDLRIGLGSLMSVYRRTVDSFPQPGTFLRADPARTAEFASWVERLGPGLKVGFSWRSMLRSVARNRFYTDLSQWEALFSVPGIVWVNLQYDRCEEELTHAQNRFGVTLHRPQLDLKDDIDGVAALSSVLDLVIGPSSTSTAIPGAVGTPAWHLVPYGPLWTMLGTDRYPWFERTRIFRQTRRGDWNGPLATVAENLRARVG